MALEVGFSWLRIIVGMLVFELGRFKKKKKSNGEDLEVFCRTWHFVTACMKCI